MYELGGTLCSCPWPCVEERLLCSIGVGLVAGCTFPVDVGAAATVDD